MARPIDDAAARSLLSQRGYEAQHDRGFMKTVDVIADLYDVQSNPGGFISLGVAENRLMHAEMVEWINKNFSLPAQALTYRDGGFGHKGLREVVASFLNEQLRVHKPLSEENVIVLPGLTTAIEGLAIHLANPGEALLLGRPYYNSFPLDVGVRAGVNIVTVSFGDGDPFDETAVEKYEEALVKLEAEGVKVKGLILCSPHNPLGRCYPRETIRALLRFCQKHQINFISDEVYALSVWHNPEYPDATGFTSVLELDLEDLIDPRLVHVLWGLSKDFGANGLRLGCMISRNEPLLMAHKAYSLFTYPSAASEMIAVRLLADKPFLNTYISTNRTRLATAYSLAKDFLELHAIPYAPGSNAAFFLWIELRSKYLRNRGKTVEEIKAISMVEGLSIDQEIHSRMMEKKIFLGKGKAFGAEKGGWWRVVFSQDWVYVEEGLKRVIAAVEVD